MPWFTKNQPYLIKMRQISMAGNVDVENYNFLITGIKLVEQTKGESLNEVGYKDNSIYFTLLVKIFTCLVCLPQLSIIIFLMKIIILLLFLKSGHTLSFN